MRLKLENSLSEMPLSCNFKPVISPYNKRIGIQKRYGKDGGVITGDQRVDVRDIVLSYNVVETEDEDYIDILNSLVGFFRRELSPYYLVDTDNDRRTQIVLASANDTPSTQGTELRIGNNSLKLKMLDSHWEDYTELEVNSPSGGMVNNDTLLVVNDSYIECFPVIKIRPSDTNTDFLIKNTTTGSAFVIGSASFVVGSELTIDSQEGTIYLNDGVSQTESSAALADGSGFISLVPGNNSLIYQSGFGPIDMDVLYRKRYAF